MATSTNYRSIGYRRGYRDLANAIVTQAADDYRKALDGISYNCKPPEFIIQEIEDFFRSSWFRMLTKLDGGWLIMKLKKEHMEKEKERLCESN